ncbi:MAG: hypothetical protein AMXMBFR36_25550 [Acidobacteriota bacterium]
MPTRDPAVRRFPQATAEAIDRARILGVRSGSEHRFTAVWVVVVDGRIFVRSWYDKPTGWLRAFRAEPRGAISFAGREVAVEGRPVRSATTRAAVTRAYATKYPTKGSLKWVTGFAEPEREVNTLEFVPAGRASTLRAEAAASKGRS